jgi:hypothetical protein
MDIKFLLNKEEDEIEISPPQFYDIGGNEPFLEPTEGLRGKIKFTPYQKLRLHELGIKTGNYPSKSQIEELAVEFNIPKQKISKHFWNINYTLKKQRERHRDASKQNKSSRRRPFQTKNFTAEQVNKLRLVAERTGNHPPPDILTALETEFGVPKRKIQAYFRKRVQNEKQERQKRPESMISNDGGTTSIEGDETLSEGEDSSEVSSSSGDEERNPHS